jgi:hypothetical protein
VTRDDETIRIDVDDATSILRSLTSGGVETTPDLSSVDRGELAAGDGIPNMWF